MFFLVILTLKRVINAIILLLEGEVEEYLIDDLEKSIDAHSNTLLDDTTMPSDDF